MSDKFHAVPNWNVPRGGMFTIIQDSWWRVDDNGSPLFSSKHNTPMCNDNPDIARRLSGGSRIEQLPFVYVPLRIQDYVD